MIEYITPNYETISVIQKRNLMELMGSSLLNAFSEQDYFDVIQIFNRVIERLENIEKGGIGVFLVPRSKGKEGEGEWQ